MPDRDPRVDAYIDSAARFAQPVLARIREIVHRACPDGEETIKWGRPSFEYRGLMCGVAAFKAHCTLRFWKAEQIAGDDPDSRAAMQALGRIESIEGLPPRKVLAGFVKRAMELNAAGVKPLWQERRKAKKRKPEAAVPPELAEALGKRKHTKAKATWDGFSPSHRREYVEWITEAKREETRAKRVAHTLEWLAEGKPRNWKYM